MQEFPPTQEGKLKLNCFDHLGGPFLNEYIQLNVSTHYTCFPLWKEYVYQKKKRNLLYKISILIQFD